MATEGYKGICTLWHKYNAMAQYNKEKRKAIGEWSPEEPHELICDENCDEEFHTWKDSNLYSCYWVADLLGSDIYAIQTLLCHKDWGGVKIDGILYYRERFLLDCLEILKLLSKTSFVNNLRPLPQEVKDKAYAVYTSKDLQALLDVKEATLRKYRDDGVLGYSRVGDKIWYRQEDLDAFLLNPIHRYNAFKK